MLHRSINRDNHADRGIIKVEIARKLHHASKRVLAHNTDGGIHVFNSLPTPGVVRVTQIVGVDFIIWTFSERVRCKAYADIASHRCNIVARHCINPARRHVAARCSVPRSVDNLTDEYRWIRWIRWIRISTCRTPFPQNTRNHAHVFFQSP